MKFWILNQRWTRYFFISHISGWIIATLQTIWIIIEVRRYGKKILAKQSRKRKKTNE